MYIYLATKSLFSRPIYVSLATLACQIRFGACHPFKKMDVSVVTSQNTTDRALSSRDNTIASDRAISTDCTAFGISVDGAVSAGKGLEEIGISSSPSLPNLSPQNSREEEQLISTAFSSSESNLGESRSVFEMTEATLKTTISCPNVLSFLNKKQLKSIKCHGFEIKKYHASKLQRDYLLNAKHAKEKLRESINKISHNGKEDFKFFITANQQYRLDGTIPYCPICLEMKGNQPNQLGRSTIHPQCHIFPECLLKAYLKNHFHGAKSEDKLENQSQIYDHFSESFKSAHKLTYPLFCYKCESNASSKEDFLKSLYISIMGGNGRLVINREQLDNLKNILSLLLFRGILYSIDFVKLVKEEYFPKFMDTVQELRKFCALESSNSWIPESLCISILPNAHVNPFVPIFILELQLRNPLYTTLVANDNSAGVYLYTKFDCFHCVLPLDDKSLRYFNKFNYFKEGSKMYELPHGRIAIQSLFPMALLQHAMDNIGEFVKILTSLDSPANIVIESHDSGTKTLKIPPAPTQLVEKEDFSTELSNEESLVSSAFKNSSIAWTNHFLLHEKLEKEIEKNKILEEEIEKLKGENSSLKKTLEHYKSTNVQPFSYMAQGHLQDYTEDQRGTFEDQSGPFPTSVQDTAAQ